MADLESSVLIVQNNKLKVDYTISMIEKYLDLISNSVVVASKNIDSSAQIKAFTFDDLNSISQTFEHNNLNSYGFVPYSQYLESIANVAYSNLMQVVYDLVQAPVMTQTSYATHDTYIRRERPTLNHGLVQSLIVGNSVADEYMTLIQIDISDFNKLKDAYVLSGELVLSAYNWGNTTIDVYEVYNDWIETNVTWNSFQSFQLSEDPIFSISGSSSEIRFDILDYLNDLKLQGKSTVNIVLKINSDLSSNYNFFSKDSPYQNNHPRIEVRYHDVNWNGFLGRLDLECYATVIGKDNRDLASWGIARQLKPLDLNGSALIGRWGWNDLVSTAFPVYKKVLQSYANIFNSIELDSEVSIPGYGSDEIESFIEVVRSNDLLSDSNVTPNTNLESIVTILVRGQKDLESLVDVLQNRSLDSFAQISQFKELLSNSEIHHSIELQSSANVYRPAEMQEDFNELDSSAEIYNTLDIDSQVEVFHFSNLEAIAEIYKKLDLEGTADVLAIKNLISEALVVRRGIDDLEVQALFRQFDIDEISGSSFVMGAIFKQLDCTAVVKRIGRADSLLGIVEITTTARKWVPGTHARDQFKHTNKLPRVWKRDDFII